MQGSQSQRFAEMPDVGNLMSSRRRWWVGIARLAAFAAIGAATLFASGFGLFANHVSHLAEPRNPPAADAIIVLTGGQSRLDAAMKLLKTGKGKRLLISGVNPSAKPSDLQAVTGDDGSMFSCCVDIDYAALDTIGNAAESAKWVEAHKYDSVILVTNNYHMPRSLLEMSRFLGEAELSPYPVVNTPLHGGGWVTKPDALRVIFTEYTKYLLAMARTALPGQGAGELLDTFHVSSTRKP